MIKEVSLVDWLRLVIALTALGVLLYYNPQITAYVTNWMGITRQSEFQYDLVRWLFILISISFLGIATARKHILEIMAASVLLTGVHFLQRFVLDW